MISNLPEDNSLYENIISGILANESPPITSADVGREYYIINCLPNGKHNVAIVDRGILHSIINKIDLLLKTSSMNSQSMVFVFWIEDKQKYSYIYNSDLIFSSINKLKSYCGIHEMDIYYSKFFIKENLHGKN